MGRCVLMSTCTAVSPTTRSSAARVSSAVSDGRMRQFTFASASCGRAFVAWPPESIVATHVVRRIEL